MSVVPDTLPPGCSSLSTSRAVVKLVTAVPNTGMSFVAFAIACTAGVAMATTKSELRATNRWAMVFRLD